MYIGTLIQTIIRPRTGNVDFSVDDTTGVTVEGISQNEVLSFVNDGLAFLQSRIIASYPGEFIEEEIQNTVQNQEEYTIGDNLFLNKLISVEYSDDGNTENFDPLPPAGLQQRDTRLGRPYQYIRRNKKILLNRIPNKSGASIRVNFYRALDKLNIRRGIITGKTSTVITLGNTSILDSFDIGNAQYICIVDALGNVKDYNVVVTSYNSSTREITIPSQTLVGAVNDYIVTGRYQSTHLPEDKPDRILDFVKLYTQARIFNNDSSTDEIIERQEVADCLKDIMDQYENMTDDIQDVPIIDPLLKA